MKKYTVKEAMELAKAQIVSENMMDRERRDRLPIILSGPAGVGKTYIAKQIADELDMPFVEFAIPAYNRAETKGIPKVIESTLGLITVFTKPEIIFRVEEAILDKNKSIAIQKLESLISEANSTFNAKIIVELAAEKINDAEEFEATVRYEITDISIQRTALELLKKELFSNTPTVLFIDEINTAAESVKPQMRDLLQHGKIGEHKLPDNCTIIGACNPSGDINDQAVDFDDTLRSRTRKIEVTPDLNTWLQYAYKENMHQMVISFLISHPHAFCTEFDKLNGLYSSNPRIFEKLSLTLNMYETMLQDESLDTKTKDIIEKAYEDITIGGGIFTYIENVKIAQEFTTFALIYKEMSDVDDILNGIEKNYSIDNLDKTMAITGNVIQRLLTISDESVNKMGYLKSIIRDIDSIQKGETTKSDVKRKISDDIRNNTAQIQDALNQSSRNKELVADLKQEKIRLNKANKFFAELMTQVPSDQVTQANYLKTKELELRAEGNKTKEHLNSTLTNVLSFMQGVFRNCEEVEATFYHTMVNNRNLLKFGYAVSKDFRKTIERHDTEEADKKLAKDVASFQF